MPTQLQLFRFSTNHSHNQCHLSTSLIVIDPQNIYEIRLTMQNFTAYCYTFYIPCELETEVKVNEVNQTFLENPFDRNSSNRGLVSQLDFHPI